MPIFFFIITFFLGYTTAFADAIIVTKAMLSPTIAEYYVDNKGVKLELEIGGKDVNAFTALYPESYRKLMHLPAEDFNTRTQRYLTGMLAVLVEGEPLKASILSIEVGKKIKRDNITGEPLPVQDENVPKVLYMTIVYPFVTPKPKEMTIKGPTNAIVGFMLYHEGQNVNDFRYLAQEQHLILDWDNPFYSHFKNKGFLRQYSNPMSLFLYIEPYEVRKEFVLHPRDLQHWVDLGLKGKDVITVQEQKKLKRKISDFLMDRAKVEINGKMATPRLDRIHFIERTLKRSGVVTPPRDLETNTATLGVIYSYPTPSTAKKVMVEWDLFNEKINMVPIVFTDEAGPFRYRITADEPKITWDNYILHPKDRNISTVHVTQSTIALPLLTLLLSTLFLVLITLYILRKKKILLVLAIISLLAALLSWPLVKINIDSPIQAKLDNKEARLLLNELLGNVYRSFVFKEEGAIYDALSKSVDGDLLSEIYLQVKRSLELKNQGGAEASVDTIEIKDLKLTELDNGYALDASWDVNGSVGHWGHIHQRANHYDAEFVIEPVKNVWKIKTMKVYNEKRIK